MENRRMYMGNLGVLHKFSAQLNFFLIIEYSIERYCDELESGNCSRVVMTFCICLLTGANIPQSSL